MARLDALFSFADPQNVTLNVHVNGDQHLIWVAQQAQSRTAPQPFPGDLNSQGNGTAPWPTLPSLAANVTWSSPLANAAGIWVLLSAEPCTLGSVCDISRSLTAEADAGATSPR